MFNKFYLTVEGGGSDEDNKHGETHNNVRYESDNSNNPDHQPLMSARS